MYSADVQLHYDPAQMKVQDENPRLEGVQITPGPLLASDPRFVANNRADLENGQIDFVFTLLKPASPLNGDGILATIAFEIRDAGPYLIEVSRARLVSAQLEAVPVTTENLYLNGALQPITQPQYLISTGTAWQRWRTIALISLLLALALLVILRSRWLVAVLAGRNGGQPTPQRVSNSARSSLRSSALLSEQGHHALSQNDIERAYKLFSQAIELDPANAKAWLGRGLVAQQRMEKLICFQRVLALDPNNRRAKLELNQLSSPDTSK
jgi:tetratricopeptide (TPR) repeat protein